MPTPSILSTLKLRIVAVTVGTALLAAAGTAASVLSVAQDRLIEQVLVDERNARERTAALLGSKLGSLTASIAAVAEHAPIEMLGDRAAVATFLLDRAALSVLYDSYFIADASGSVLARVENGKLFTEPLNIADRTYFTEAMGGDRPVFSEPLEGRLHGAPVTVIAAAMRAADGRSVGIVAGSLRLQSAKFLADLTGRPDPRAIEFVMSREGRLLSHPDAGRILGDARSDPGMAGVPARWAGRTAPPETGASSELTDDHLVSSARIPFSNWLLVRVAERKQALAPVEKALNTAILATVLVALFAALLSGAVAWSIARPIANLRSKIEGLLRNDARKDEPWPVQAGEIDAISQAFQSLLAVRDGQNAALEAFGLQLQAVLDNANVGIALTRNGRFELVSTQLCRIFGHSRERLLGEPTLTIHRSGEAYQAFSKRADPAFLAHGHFDGEAELVRASGEVFWARLRGRAVVPGDRSRGTIWVIEDATESRQQREHLSWAASHDSLTGLLNRAAFEALLDAAVPVARDHPFCVLFIDLDRFKRVNDVGGHAAGDAMLRAVAQALQAQLRKSDALARLGGDEFAVFLPGCPLPTAQQLAETLRDAVDQAEVDWESQRHSVGISVGLVMVNGLHATTADVLRAADLACYQAKGAGRNRVAVSQFDVDGAMPH